MSGPTPPSAGDIEIALAAYGWPAVALRDGTVLAGEETWRLALEDADDAGRWRLWRALRGEDDADNEDDDDDERSDDE
jgi:hypothetical protein